MPTYDITGPDGTAYEVDAPDDAAVQEAVQKMFGGGQPAQQAADPAVARMRNQLLATPAGQGQPPQILTADPRGAELSAAPEPSLLRTAGYAMQEGRKGITGLLGAPVDLINQSPRLMNLLPGVEGVQPFMQNPPLGSQNWEYMATFGGAAEPIQPAGAVDRIIGRTAYELGATALPLTGALAYGPVVGANAARRMATAAPSIAAPSAIPGVQALDQTARYAGNAVRNLTGSALETAAVAPGRLAGKEVASGTAAGLGAGVANEIAGNPQTGDNFGSDFAGSLAGVGTVGATNAVLGAGKRLAAGALGRPEWMGDVAGQAVAERIMNNSTLMADRALSSGSLDTGPLSRQLRTPSPIEQVIPGYQANIGDRTLDPRLQTFAYNQDALSPGAANARRTANETIVNERMGQLAPTGTPGQFRADIQQSVDQRLAEANAGTAAAQQSYDAANQAVIPVLPNDTARGTTMRSAVQDAYDAENARVNGLWAPINQSQQQVDIAPLAQRYQQADDALSMNEYQRFRPAEADLPQQLVQPATPPQPTGLLDAQGNPIIRPGQPPQGTVPLNEVAGIRSGLTDDTRALRASGRRNEARVVDQYRQQLDDFAEGAIPQDLRDQYQTARQGTYDLNERFNRPGTAMRRTLETREGGGYRLDDNAVTSQFNQPDRGNLNDFRALMREAGQDPRARTALADDIRADVQRRRLNENPANLNRYLAERGVVLDEFPELRSQLEQVSRTRLQATETERAAAELNRDLTTPGRSPEASYLRYGNERVIDAVRTVINAPSPREAARTLLEAAGDTPTARQNARAAFWEVVGTNRYRAPGMTGNDRWDGKKLRALLDDPKSSAVMQEMWSDAPDQLRDIRQVFDALATSEGSLRARAPNSSGTAQALNGKFDPAMSSTAVASRLRSVNRGQLSPSIAAVDLVSTWLRNRSKQVQARAIEGLTADVVNNPGLAADLLDKYNPADYAAKRRMIFQKYGVRATQALNLLDEANGSDPTIDAIKGE